MKKSTMISVIIFILGCVFVVSGTLMGGLNDLTIPTGHLSFLAGDGESVNYICTDRITTLDIDIGYSRIDFEESDESFVSVIATNTNDRMNVKQTGTTLKISQPQTILDYDRCTNITVYVPKDYQFDKISLDVTCGQCHVGSVKTKNMTYHSRFSELIVDSLSCQSLSGATNLGSSTFRYIKNVDNIDMTVAAGSVDMKLKEDLDNYGYRLEASLGSIDYGDVEVSGIEKKTHQRISKNINLDCRLGEIDIE